MNKKLMGLVISVVGLIFVAGTSFAQEVVLDDAAKAEIKTLLTNMDFDRMLEMLSNNDVAKQEKLTESLIGLFGKSFTKEEIGQLNNFFASDVAKKFKEVTPQIMQDLMREAGIEQPQMPPQGEEPAPAAEAQPAAMK